MMNAILRARCGLIAVAVVVVAAVVGVVVV